MKFRILQANMISDDYEWHLHATNCQELVGPKYDFSDLFLLIDAEDARTAVEDWIDPELQEMGWRPDHVKVFPCTDPSR